MAGAIGLAAWQYFNVPPGYRHNTATWWPLDKVWTAGLKHPAFPNVVSHARPGFWEADPGFVFQAKKKGDLTTVWSPNRPHPTLPLRAARSQGEWLVEPGYAFSGSGGELAPTRAIQSGRSAIVWRPGTPHPVCANLLAANKPGSWQAVNGYRFVNPGTPGDFTLEPIPPSSSGSFSDQLGAAAGPAIMTAIACMNVPYQKTDGLLEMAERHIAKEICGQGIKATAQAFTNAGAPRPTTLGAGSRLRCDYWSLEWKRAPRRHSADTTGGRIATP